MNASSHARSSAYGLVFACDFALPELRPAPAEEAPDITIETGDFLSPALVEAALRAETPVEELLHFEDERFQITFNKVGRFTVTQGRHVLLEPIRATTPALWRLPLLGSVLALLLEQRGFFVLHAGAVEIGGVAAAFLGEKGQGKSTLNAALALAGFPLLSDDVVALDWPSTNHSGASFPQVAPGFSQIKLVPDAVHAILPDALENWPAVTPDVAEIDKRAFQATLAQDVLPLRHLFVLSTLGASEKENPVKNEGANADFRLQLLAPQQAFARLIPHTYGARFGDFYLKNERKKTHFSACARLVRECCVWELARRRDFALLPATIRAIQNAVESHSMNTPAT